MATWDYVPGLGYRPPPRKSYEGTLPDATPQPERPLFFTPPPGWTPEPEPEPEDEQP